MSNNIKVKRLAQQTVQQFTEELLRSSSLSNKKITTLIQSAISNAYDKVEKEEKDALFREFALILHPDKLETSNKKLYDYLNQAKNEADNAGVDVIDIKKAADKVAVDKTTPMKILSAVREEDLLIRNFWRDVRKNPGVLFSRPFKNPLVTNITRYVMPLRIVITLAYVMLVAGLLLAVLAGFIIGGAAIIALAISKLIAEGLLKIITFGKYNQLVDAYKEEKFFEHKKTYLSEVKIRLLNSIREKTSDQEIERIEKMDDDTFFDYLVSLELANQEDESIIEAELPATSEIEKSFIENIKKVYVKTKEDVSADINKKIREGVSAPSEITLLKLAFASVFQALKTVNGNKWLSFLIIKPLQVTASVFVLGAIICNELALFLLIGSGAIGVGLGGLIYYASLIALNIPLAVYDFSIGRYFKNAKNDSVVPGKDQAMKLLLLEYHPDDVAEQQAAILQTGKSERAEPKGPEQIQKSSFSNGAPEKYVENYFTEQERDAQETEGLEKPGYEEDRLDRAVQHELNARHYNRPQRRDKNDIRHSRSKFRLVKEAQEDFHLVVTGVQPEDNKWGNEELDSGSKSLLLIAQSFFSSAIPQSTRTDGFKLEDHNWPALK